MRLTRETHVDCLVARDVYIIGPLRGLETMALARTRSEILHFDQFCLAFIIGACCGHIYCDNVDRYP